MDRYELDDEVIYISSDRTCVFVEQGKGKPVRLANEQEITDLWDRHRIIALLSVFRSITSPGSSPSSPISTASGALY
jgi:hypothetical protein